MAETLTIEIPIEAVDRTSAGVQSATKNLTAFERAWDRTQRRLDRLERAHNIDIELDDNASQGLSRVSDQAESLDGVSPSVDVGVNNAATETLSDVADQAATLDGTASDVDVGADDNASPVIDDVMDKAAAWDGSVWTATVSVVDAATAPISAIINAAKNPLTQAGAALGISVGLGDTVNTYKSFESMMSQVQAISGATG